MGLKQQSDTFKHLLLDGRRTPLKPNSETVIPELSCCLCVSKYYSIGGGDAVFILKIGAFGRFKAAADRAALVYLRVSFFCLFGAYEGRSDVLGESGETPPS